MRDKAFNFAKKSKYDGYQRGLVSMFYKCFDKKTSCGAATPANKSAFKNGNISNKELAKELHKPIFRKFKKRKVHSIFINNIYNIYSKYAWVIPLKDKKGITITNAF